MPCRFVVEPPGWIIGPTSSYTNLPPFPSFSQRLFEAAKRRDAECAAEYLSVETSNARMARDELKVTVASTGHDMKSPVTALALAVESVIDTLMDGRSNKDELPPRQAQAVGVCVDAFCTVMQLNQIINRSTDYTKVSVV